MDQSEKTPADSRDRTQRFLFEDADIRGEIVQLHHTYREIIAVHQYAPGVSRLLGEFLAAGMLLQLLYRLYHEDPLRLFDPLAVVFHCNCSRQRTLSALSTLDPGELVDLLEEQGSITMDCEFCNQQYRFAREDLEEVLGSDESKTLH
jgi:redox-regulated HSP33 family molecular chaperone